MAVSDEELLAYVDGELDAPSRARVEDEIAQDASLRERVTRERRLRDRLHAAYDPILREPVPKALRALTGPEESKVVELARAKPRPSFSESRMRFWAMAACAVFGILIGAVAVLATREPEQFALNEHGGLIANGALARALTTQTAANSNSDVRVALSFQAKSGDYCRAFVLEQSSMAGVACHEQSASNGWQIRLLTETEHGSKSSYRTASSSIPSAVAELIEREMEGEPLDAQAEARAIERRWQ